MSDDLKVDWGKPIEDENGVPMQYHEHEGTTERKYPRYVTCPSDSMIVSYYNDYGRPWSDHKPRIRNVAEPSQADIGIPMTDDLAKRVEVFVTKVAHAPGSAVAGFLRDEAKSLRLALQPVDADLAFAREIIADAVSYGEQSVRQPEAKTSRDFRSGECDAGDLIARVVKQLRTRALERDSKSNQQF